MTEYIDRETAIAKLTALEVTEPSATMIDAKRLLAEMPAADVAPVVHGCWIHYDGVVICSECGDAETSESCYCKHCGAKMGGKGEEA